MKPKEKLLDTPAGLLHYRVFGNGNIPLLAFHGFGQDSTVFSNLDSKILEHYSVFAFDIFYHGLSNRSTDQPLTRVLWQRAFEQFCMTESIETYETLGFSMGGKFAVASMLCRPALCKAFYGIAPDGIQPNYWHDLATYPIGFQKIFKSLLNNPKRLFAVIDRLQKFRLVNPNLAQFARQQLATEDLRYLVYLVWVMFKDIQYKQNDIANAINQHKIKAVFYIGLYDRLLPPNTLNTFFGKLEAHQCIELPTSHAKLLERSLQELVI